MAQSWEPSPVYRNKGHTQAASCRQKRIEENNAQGSEGGRGSRRRFSGVVPDELNDTCLLMLDNSLRRPVTRPDEIRHAAHDRPIGAIAGARTPHANACGVWAVGYSGAELKTT